MGWLVRIHVSVVGLDRGLCRTDPTGGIQAPKCSRCTCDASLMANPHKTALTQPAHLGAVHLVQSVAHFLHRRALRRICSDGSDESARASTTPPSPPMLLKLPPHDE